MDMWMWALLVLLIVVAITWYVLARRGRRSAAVAPVAVAPVAVAPVAVAPAPDTVEPEVVPDMEPADDSWAAPKPKVEWDEPVVDLGDLEHASSVEERPLLGDAPHGAGEGTRAGAEPVPYVTPVAEAALVAGPVAEAETVAEPAEEPQPTEEAASGLGDWRAAAEAEPEVEQIWDGPFGPGSAEAGEDGEGPLGWTVKAARQTKVYLTPEVPVYTQARANVWFVDEQRAIDAGFRRWDVPNK